MDNQLRSAQLGLSFSLWIFHPPLCSLDHLACQGSWGAGGRNLWEQNCNRKITSFGFSRVRLCRPLTGISRNCISDRHVESSISNLCSCLCVFLASTRHWNVRLYPDEQWVLAVPPDRDDTATAGAKQSLFGVRGATAIQGREHGRGYMLRLWSESQGPVCILHRG